MNLWFFFGFIFFISLALLFFLWVKVDRQYISSKTVAEAYDRWTNDQLLESLWGDHVHLGYYCDPPIGKDFRTAKVDLVHYLVKWSGLDKLPKGSKVLDVGCGIGGSSRILAEIYGFDVLGITISPKQVHRANQLTPDNINCRFEVMDALDLQYENETFDAVWSVEAGPHMPDKQRYADELLRVLRPGGVLAVADWNRKDFIYGKYNFWERLIMNQLLNQWAHPDFSSIQEFQQHLEQSDFSRGVVEIDDWTNATLPSWNASILEGFKRPKVILSLGPLAVIKAIREVPTIVLMNWAFANGLMYFGVFRIGD